MESISLDLLKTFVSYAETGSVHETASLLGLSQPGVTGHLQRLVSLLPEPLFVAQGRTKALTAYGEALAAALRGPLADAARAVERTNLAYGDPANLTLRIGCRREIMPRVADVIRFPGTLTFLPLAGDTSLAQLASGQLDGAVVQTVPAAHGFFATPLFEDDCALVTDGAWLRHAGISLKQALSPVFLASVPFIAYRQNPPFMREVLEPHGMTLRHLRIRASCEDWVGVVALAANGFGYSIVPSSIAASRPGLQVLPVPRTVVKPTTFHFVCAASLMETPKIRDALVLG